MTKGTKKFIGTIEKIVACAIAVFLWQLAAVSLNQKILLAAPADVIKALFTIIGQKDFFSILGFSCGHILAGFLLGLLFGVVFAVLAGKFHFIEVFLWPYMAVVKATPVASFIILCLVWLSSRNISIFISFIIVLPVVYTNLLNGIKNLDPDMKEMAAVFGIKPLKRIMYIDIPQLKTYILAAFEISMAMAWKAGVAAEVIGIPEGSIGRMLYNAKIYLETPELFAWTIIIVVVSVLFEKLVIQLLKKLTGVGASPEITGFKAAGRQ